MKLIKLYSWIAGSMADFTKPFRENEALYKQARTFWMKLENISLAYVIICVVLGILFSAYYYTSYNKTPGRHYTPKHWVLWLLIAFVTTFAVTFIFEYIAVPPKLSGAIMLEIKVALCNAIYAVFLYLVVSLIWCNCKYCPTNAYKLFKI